MTGGCAEGSDGRGFCWSVERVSLRFAGFDVRLLLLPDDGLLVWRYTNSRVGRSALTSKLESVANPC
jgi:hypothetical protein